VKKSRVLVTGGCGFIGVNLIDYLLKIGGFDLRVLDNLSVGTKENLVEVAGKHSVPVEEISSGSKLVPPLSDAVHFVMGDIRDSDTCIKSTEGVDMVVHLAAHAGVIPSIEDPYYDFEVNTLGTLNLLSASVENKVEKFIFASSNAPMGDQPPPMNEGLVPRPLSPYGASKLACEGYCSAFYGSYGLKTVILRFSNAYGPYSLHKNSVIAKFIKDGLTEGRLTVYGDGLQTRDFIHVDDLSNVISIILNEVKYPGAKPWGDTFHLGTGRETKIIDLAEIVKRLFNEEPRIVFEPPRIGEIKRNYSDTGKAMKVFGFSSKVGLEDGIRGLYEWFLGQGMERIQSVRTLSGSE
jgi:UDP-glucose 4-epimerase